MAGLTYCNNAEAAEPVDGMVRINLVSGDGLVPLLLTRHAAMRVSRSIDACLAVLKAAEDPVIPLCEFCVRHDLPTLAKKREG